MTYLEKQEKERKQERNKNLICCFIFLMVITLSPFIESIFNLNI